MAPRRILIVEDEILIARELEARLTGLGYEVVGIAATGREAIHLTGAARPDLVLMDIVLKGDLDGIDAAREIRRQHRVPVIYLTAYTDRDTLDRARVTEPYGYIVKPFSEREIFAGIEMALYKHAAEARLRRLERWFSASTDQMGEALVVADPEGCITLFNSPASEITRWPASEAIGRPMEEVLRFLRVGDDPEPIPLEPPDSGPLVLLAGEAQLLDRSGRLTPVACTVSSLRNDSGAASGRIAVLRDPTGVRHGLVTAVDHDLALAAARSTTLRDLLQSLAEALRRHLDAAAIQFWTLSSSGEFLQLQAAAGDATPMARPPARIRVGEDPIGRIARDRRPVILDAGEPIRRPPAPAGDESAPAPADHESAPAPADLELAPAPADHESAPAPAFAGFPLMVEEQVLGALVILTRQPIAGRLLQALEPAARSIALAIDRKSLQDQLRQSQKMESIGQLAAGVAHDFNNLLTVITGYTSLVLERMAAGDESHPRVLEIERAARRATSLVQQLLAFSRRQVLDPRRVQLSELVQEMSEILGRLIGEDIRLSIRATGGLPPVMVDPGQLEQVIMNLAVNARDAMPRGGHLSIETDLVDVSTRFLDIDREVKPGPYVLLAISDSGVGMTADVLGHIFEPFFTTKEPGRGTGLGLATVHGIIHQSGGYIQAYSEPGIGTTFKIYLPAASGPGDAEPVAPPRAGRVPATHHETILLVEDEPALRSLSQLILEQCGYRVIVAEDGEAALRVARDHEGTIDLVLTDVVMPGRSGRSMVEELLRQRPAVRVLFVSGYTDEALDRNGVVRTEGAFLQKPFTIHGLTSRVREVLDR